MRRLRTWPSRHHPKGLLLVWAVPAVCLVMLAVRIFSAGSTNTDPFWDTLFRAVDRTPIIQRLQADGGKHLVIVRYELSHNPHSEWVYNGADLNAAPIVWARDMGATADEALIRHYPGRRVWLLEPDERGIPMTPYSAAVAQNVTNRPGDDGGCSSGD